MSVNFFIFFTDTLSLFRQLAMPTIFQEKSRLLGLAGRQFFSCVKSFQ